jgi:hypothetical protein
VGNRNFRAFSLADVYAAVEAECVLNAGRLELMAEWKGAVRVEGNV